jgi:GT2 family glycosyltransferase
VWRESESELRRFADAVGEAWSRLPPAARGQSILIENGARPGAGDEAAAHLSAALGVEPERLTSPRNLGPAQAYNLGACRATNRYFALLDVDGAPAPDTLLLLVDALEADEHAAVAAAGIAAFGHRKPAGPAAIAEEEWVSAGATLYRAAAFREVGGFDDLFAYACEEMDLGYRLRRAGWRCLRVPRAVFHHEVEHKMTFRRERLFREYLMVWRHIHSSRLVVAKSWLAQMPLLVRLGRRHGWAPALGGLIGLLTYVRHIPAAERRRAG